MPDMSAALREYQGYRYTVTIIANSALPATVEAELWWQRQDKGAKWRYFGRRVGVLGVEAARRVEADFKEWVRGQLEAAD